MNVKSISLLLGLIFFSWTESALAITFNYFGAVYTDNPLADSVHFGTSMTGSVTLSCSPCADGTYLFSNPFVTAYHFTSGSVTQPQSAFNTNSTITLSGGGVFQWNIDSISGGSGTNSLEMFANSSFSFPGFYQLLSPFNVVISFAAASGPGSWETCELCDAPATPLPAALPLFATGLGVIGLVARRRKRKNAAAVAVA